MRNQNNKDKIETRKIRIKWLNWKEQNFNKMAKKKKEIKRKRIEAKK
jgi:hypothetical protein